MVRIVLLGSLLHPAAIEAGLVYGVGVASCEAWASARSASHTPGPTFGKTSAYEHWVLGYMTGFGAFGPAPRGGQDAKFMFDYVDRYCAANPDDTIDDAVADMAVTVFGEGLGVPLRR